MDSIDAAPGRERERKDGLIVQHHGGALKPPFTARNHVGGFGKAKRESIRLINEGTPEAARRLMRLVMSPDERVAVIATIHLLTRTMGVAGEAPPDGEAAKIDLADLNADERVELVAALATVRRLQEVAAAKGRQKPASELPSKITRNESLALPGRRADRKTSKP